MKNADSDAQPAHPAELLAEHLVGADSTVTGLTAQSQLAHHDDEAAADSQDQVDQKEREAAACTHLIGEAPDVAQADRRTDSSHQESKIGSKAFSFFHCFLSLILSYRPGKNTVYCEFTISGSGCK